MASLETKVYTFPDLSGSLLPDCQWRSSGLSGTETNLSASKHVGAAIPHAALRQAQVPLQPERVYFQAGHLPTRLTQSTRGQGPAQHPTLEPKQQHLVYVFPRPRGDLHFLPHLLLDTKELGPSY